MSLGALSTRELPVESGHKDLAAFADGGSNLDELEVDVETDAKIEARLEKEVKVALSRMTRQDRAELESIEHLMATSPSTYSEPDISIRALYFHQIGKTPLLGKDEFKVAQHVRSGDLQARELFIRANLRLVTAIAKRYRRSDVDILDLIQAGNIGLMKAVEKFEPERGHKFSSFVFCWIRACIRDYFHLNSTVSKVSNDVYWQGVKARRTKARLELVTPPDEVMDALARDMKLSRKRVGEILADPFLKGTISLSKPSGARADDGNSDATLEDFVANSLPPQDEHVDRVRMGESVLKRAKEILCDGDDFRGK